MDFSLLDISKKLTASSSDNIEIILVHIAKSLGSELCVYAKVDKGGSIIQVLTSNGRKTKKVDSKNYASNEQLLSTLESKDGYHITDEIVSVEDKNSSLFGMKSCVSVQVYLEGDIRGVLSVYFKDSIETNDSSIVALQDFSGLLCIEERHLRTCRKLKVSNAKYSTVFDNSTDSIFLLSGSVIKEVNVTGCKLFDYSEDELLENSLLSLFHTTTDTEVNDIVHIKDFIDNARVKEEKHVEHEFVRSDKSVFSGEMFLTKIENACEYDLLAIIRDISKRKEYEKELIEATERANEQSKLKSMSLASMSHEIRTPLNSIIGFSGLLLDDETTEEEKEMFSKLIQTAGKSLMQLVGDIIDISKIEAGQVTIKKIHFNVNSFLQDILLTFKQEKENQDKSDIELKLVLSDKASELKIETDAHRLQQIFNNLLTNSLKFIDEGFIEFGYLSITPEYIQFYVKDTGVGIDTAKREKIFEQFGQDNTTYSRNQDGTGLGLAISKSFVELLGGKIWLDSEIDEGSTFYFTIPFDTKSQNITGLTPKLDGNNVDWSNHTIVIADDVKENYVFLNGVLSSTNINILWAKDGQEAVDFCDNEKVDIVLMDIRMPVMDGLEATKLIKKSNPGIYIIAQTAFANPEDKVNCRESGCDEYFKKPINHEKLFKVISNYFG